MIRKWLAVLPAHEKLIFMWFYLTNSSLSALTLLYLVPQIKPLDLKTQLKTSRPCRDFIITLKWETGDKVVFLPRA